MTLDSERRIEGDWYTGTVPENVVCDPQAYVETSFSFHLFRSEREIGATFGRGSSTYLGTMFDVGRRGTVHIGSFALLNGVRVICDDRIEVGDYALIAWNVVLMDTYRLPFDVENRRCSLRRYAADRTWHEDDTAAKPIRIGNNVWVGFDCCILPGVTIGEGSVIGARSVVTTDVPAYSVAVGNPARVIRQLTRG
jgi:acetyltransferase-like isoleucine patch superfamily enzyme